MNNLFAANGLIIWKRTAFDTEQKFSKFLLEIMTLVSSADNICSDAVFLHGGCSFTYITNNRGSRIDPWGTPCLDVPQSEKKNIWLCYEILLQLFAFSQLNKN